MKPLVGLPSGPIDAEAIRAHLACDGAGGEVIFTGTVRDHNQGRAVTQLAFEAYEEMALKQLEALALEIHERFEVSRVALVHRLGVVPLNEACVIVGVSAPHRAAAFDGCRHGIDALKRDVAIWKRETFEGGEVWVTNHA